MDIAQQELSHSKINEQSRFITTIFLQRAHGEEKEKCRCLGKLTLFGFAAQLVLSKKEQNLVQLQGEQCAHADGSNSSSQSKH